MGSIAAAILAPGGEKIRKECGGRRYIRPWLDPGQKTLSRTARPASGAGLVCLVGHILDFQGNGHGGPDTLFCRFKRAVGIAVAYDLLVFPS